MKQKQTKKVHKTFEEAKNIVTGSTSKFYRPLVSLLHRLPSILHEFKTAERNRSIIISTIYINENRYKSSYSLSFYRCVCVCVCTPTGCHTISLRYFYCMVVADTQTDSSSLALLTPFRIGYNYRFDKLLRHCL